MSDQRPAGKRPTADERRRAAMQTTPTPEEVKEHHQERLETMDNPQTPVPTQEEADAMKLGTYRQRDMRPEDGVEYKTR